MTEATATYGPAYSEVKDGKRIQQQHEAIRDFMLAGGWRTLAEIEKALTTQEVQFPQASISAQLRHLRKPQFGSYRVDKRRRTEGTWEYRVRRAEMLF